MLLCKREARHPSRPWQYEDPQCSSSCSQADKGSGGPVHTKAQDALGSSPWEGRDSPRWRQGHMLVLHTVPGEGQRQSPCGPCNCTDDVMTGGQGTQLLDCCRPSRPGDLTAPRPQEHWLLLACPRPALWASVSPTRSSASLYTCSRGLPGDRQPGQHRLQCALRPNALSKHTKGRREPPPSKEGVGEASGSPALAPAKPSKPTLRPSVFT